MLAHRTAQGDEEAFAGLYDALSPLVYSICKRVLVDAGLAEEVSQEVFVTLWQQAARFDAERGSVRSWVAVMAHRRAVDRVRASQSAREREERVGREAPTAYEHVEESAVMAVEGESVLQALGRLSDAQRRAIELAYYGGLTYSEVAAATGSPLGTVKTRIRDGLSRLRLELGGSRG